MGARQLMAVALSFVLALFIRLYLALTALIFALSTSLGVLRATNERILGSWGRVKGEGERAVSEYIHIVANSSASLMLAFGILHYHEQFVEIIVLVSHHVHHWFLQLMADVPDFSSALRSSYAIKLFLCHLYLVFGYIGLSSQITLTVDLIYLCNLPTIALYKLLARLYQFLLKYFWKLIELLSKEEQQWISCPYPSWLLRDSCKVVYIGCLPVFAFLMVAAAFYYIWLAFVIVILKVVMNISLNAAVLVDQLGFLLCLLKGMQRGKNGGWKWALMERWAELEWVSIFEPSMLIEILKGNDLLTQSKEMHQLGQAATFAQIYCKLKSLIR